MSFVFSNWKCVCLLLLMLSLVVRSSLSQNCVSEDGQKKCCMGYWYAHEVDKCLRCPDGYYGENCSYVCLYPYFGEFCRQECNCSAVFCHIAGGCFPEDSKSTLCDGRSGVTCCSNYWYKKDTHECVVCNPGYYGIDCADVCPFPQYGFLCTKKCNCSVENCNYATGCSMPKIKTKDTTSIFEKSVEINQNRFFVSVLAYVFGGVRLVFVLFFILIELRERKRKKHQ